ncbi:MAG: prolipoprotein diacylglyceryl transferase family protein [Polyangiales bacterium]
MHPILFEIPFPWGPQPIYAYGVLLGLSLLVGWQITMLLGKHAGIEPATIGDAYLVAAVSGVFGARLLYVLTNFDEFTSPVQWLDLRSGGLVAYGGFLGGFIGLLIHQRIKHTSLLDLGDCAAPAIAVGLFLTRIGCYLYGCDFGVRLSENAPGWLAKLGTFPRWPDDTGELRGSPAFLRHVDAYGLSRDAWFAFPVHPTQLYEALLGLALVGLCLVLFARRAFRGQVLLVLCMVYGCARFFLEYLRDDQERGYALGFSTSQLISLLIVPAAAIAYSLLRKPQHSLRRS